VRKLDFCIVTLHEIPLVLVLKNLRLVKGGLTILKRERIYSVVRHRKPASSNKDAADYRQSLEPSFSQNDAICLEKTLASLRGL